MKKYLYVYCDNTRISNNEKTVIHNSSNLKNSTLVKEAGGRKFLMIYSLKENFEGDFVKDKFIIGYCLK